MKAVQFDASTLRQASDVPDFPYWSRALTLLLVKGNGLVTQAYNKEAKRALLVTVEDGDLLLGAWTGAYHTDVFAVDIERARDAA